MTDEEYYRNLIEDLMSQEVYLLDMQIELEQRAEIDDSDEVIWELEDIKDDVKNLVARIVFARKMLKTAT